MSEKSLHPPPKEAAASKLFCSLGMTHQFPSLSLCMAGGSATALPTEGAVTVLIWADEDEGKGARGSTERKSEEGQLIG